jgi:hypothetical protein
MIDIIEMIEINMVVEIIQDLEVLLQEEEIIVDPIPEVEIIDDNWSKNKIV